MIPVTVAGVRMEMPSNTPIVLLQEESGTRYVPIWVGAVEATAIAYAQQGVMPPRPLTHDLFIDMVSGLKAKIQSVRITDLTDGVFFAVIDLARSDGSIVQISARPSDAIAIALRADAPISASEEVVDQAGVEIPMDSDSEGTSTGVPEDQVEKFREFLEGISPEDFDSPNG
jgi:bifunctional DNase/RNase